MSQVRKHGSDAERQAAYRRRQAQARAVAPQRSLPGAPALPTMPGRGRWTAALNWASQYVAIVAQEMQAYHDDRTERWQESERGERFFESLGQIEQLAELIDEVKDLTN